MTQRRNHAVPNYEYECLQNAHRFEVWQPVGEAAPACPECGSQVKKIFHVPRVIFKGSGFYVTDLRSEKEAGGKKSGAQTSNESSTSSSGEGAATTPTPAASDKTSESTPKSDASSTASSTATNTSASAPDKSQSSK
jgi:putative FmdB family regulatory protein